MTEQKSNKKGAQVLAKYLPAEALDEVFELITRHPLDFSITRPRKTKLGDFRFKGPNNRPLITVNGNLNNYSFFITTIHELAHFYTFREFGPRVPAHGKEWKQTYRQMMLPFLDKRFLPKDVETAILNSLISVKASSCTDAGLYKTLKRYDADRCETKVFLDDLPIGTKFKLNNLHFQKGLLRRKRYECIELKQGKKYLVSGIAEVEVLE